MRTTVDLNDELLRKAKRLAADEGVSLRDVLERALRALLDSPRGRQKGYRLRLRTYGGGLQPGVNLEDWRALRDRMDED